MHQIPNAVEGDLTWQSCAVLKDDCIFSTLIVKDDLFKNHSWAHKVTEWKAPFFVDQTACGNTTKIAHVAARRAGV